MQTKKANVYQEVLRAARGEFLECGFQGTNMRAIAEKAGVGLSNIYNYFESKDEIFQTVLNPAITALDRTLEEHNREENLSITLYSSQEYQKGQVRKIVRLILDYREEIRILFFRSHGSSLEEYKESFIERLSETGLAYLRLMKERYPSINSDLSNFFIHSMSSWWISILSELATHKLDRDDIERFVSEYIEFATAGWKKILRIG